MKREMELQLVVCKYLLRLLLAKKRNKDKFVAISKSLSSCASIDKSFINH